MYLLITACAEIKRDALRKHINFNKYERVENIYCLMH